MKGTAITGLAGSSLFALASAGYAQNLPDDGASMALDEIIVTARRVEERLQDVPISITVFNQEQLVKRNVVNAADLANYTPSLSANNNFGSENTSFAIRGFVQDAGTPPSVGVYFADVVALRAPTQGTQAGDGAGPGSFFDLQNVQVLKGPQGTLFGRNTTGGAVLFVPQKPTYAFEGYAQGSYGNDNMNRLEGALNVPLGDDARLRIAVDHQERDGYLHNISGIGPDDYNDVDYTAARASLVLDLTANLENYTIASYSQSDTNGSVQKLIACNPAVSLDNFIGMLSCGQLAAERTRAADFHDVQAAIANPVSRIEQWQIINTTTWTATDTLTLKNIASYGEFKNLQRSPLFGTNWQASGLPAPFQPLFFRGTPAVYSAINPIPGGQSAYQSTYTEELQLQGSAWDRRLTYQAGAYFEWSDPLGLVGNLSPQLVSCTNIATLDCADTIGSAFTAALSAQLGFPFPVRVGSVNYTAGETSFRNRGLYAQSTYGLAENLKLTGGIRHTSDRQTNVATRITNNFEVLPPFTAGATPTCTDPSTAPSCTLSLQKKSQQPTWLIGLDYQPVDDVLLYTKYSRGYRAGGVFSNAPIDHRTFDPEKVDSYETGVKTTFLAPVRGTFNVSAFYNDFSKQQLQFGFNARVDPVTGASAPVSPTSAIVNAGKSRIYGAEIETSITPFVGLTFDIGYTYLDATIKRIDTIGTTDPNYQVSGGAIAPGSPLVLSPKNKYTISGDYTLPLPESLGRISFGAIFTHTDPQLTNYAYQNSAILAAFGGQNLGELPSLDLLNLNLSWNAIAGAPVDLSLFATNVTGKEYYQFVPGLATSGAEFATVGEPRMYGVRLRYEFGD